VAYSLSSRDGPATFSNGNEDRVSDWLILLCLVLVFFCGVGFGMTWWQK
jgi:hypothetical protein